MTEAECKHLEESLAMVKRSLAHTDELNGSQAQTREMVALLTGISSGLLRDLAAFRAELSRVRSERTALLAQRNTYQGLMFDAQAHKKALEDRVAHEAGKRIEAEAKPQEIRDLILEKQRAYARPCGGFDAPSNEVEARRWLTEQLLWVLDNEYGTEGDMP